MSNNPSSKALLILALTGALGVGALAYYVKYEPGALKVPAALREQPKTPEPNVEITAHKPKKGDSDWDNQVDTEVSLPKITGDDAHLDDSATPVPDGQSPLKFIAEKCLKEANVEDVKVLSVEVRHSIAIINFDDGIDNGMGGNQEGTFLKALQVAFGQFKNVDKVELQKENAPITTLGSIDLSGPLDVIRSGDSAKEDQPSKPTAP